jgi:hypothetical protein
MACALSLASFVAAHGALAADGIRRVDFPRGVLALEATPDRILVATFKPKATAWNYVRLEAHTWDSDAVVSVPFRPRCGEVTITEEGFPINSIDDAGGLIAISGISRIEHYFHGGIELAGTRTGNAVCAQFDKDAFGTVQNTGTRLIETLPPRRECVDGTRAKSCPLITPIISLNARRRIAVERGAFKLVAASGNLAIGTVSYRGGEVPRLVGFELASSTERWAQPLGGIGDTYGLFGATDGTLVALGYGSGILLLDANTGTTTHTWKNVHFALDEIAVDKGLVAWFANTSGNREAGLVYVRDAVSQHPPRVLATLPRGMTPVDIRLTFRGLVWAGTRIVANYDPTHGGAMWTASLPTVRRALRG